MNLKFSMDLGVTSKPFKMWAWGITEIGNIDNFLWGKDFKELLDFCNNTGNHKFYCRNLKKNGKIIMKWLFNNGFSYVSTKSDAVNKSFTSWIDDKSNIYSLNIYMEKHKNKVRKLTLLDSNKLINETPEQIVEEFDFSDVSLVSIDVDKIDFNNEDSTNLAVSYLKGNTIAVAKALKFIFDLGLNKNTMASNAFNEYMNTIGEKKFKKLFPTLPYELDYQIRLSYKGGYIYKNPDFDSKNINQDELVEVDVNSMYPHIMITKPLPYGEPLKFDGKYPDNSLYPLYIQNLKCNFELKSGCLPTIQLKNSRNFNGTEYLKSSNGEDVTLCLTSVDLELFFNNYYVYNIEYLGGYMFKSSLNLFNEYIDKWGKIKEESGKYKNIPLRKISKLMMNSLYGKFSISPNIQRKEPKFINNEIQIVMEQKKINQSIYIPVGTFITSYGRKRIIEMVEIYNKECVLSIILDGVICNSNNNANKFYNAYTSSIGRWG